MQTGIFWKKFPNDFWWTLLILDHCIRTGISKLYIKHQTINTEGFASHIVFVAVTDNTQRNEHVCVLVKLHENGCRLDCACRTPALGYFGGKQVHFFWRFVHWPQGHLCNFECIHMNAIFFLSSNDDMQISFNVCRYFAYHLYKNKICFTLEVIKENKM